MLTQFEVSNYEGFKNKITFDLVSRKKYDFNSDMVDHHIIKKALVYGPNGSGKSSLCSALMDITSNLVDKEKAQFPNGNYFYAGGTKKQADFSYTFKFKKDTVRYEYCKTSPTSLAFEKLYWNGKQVIEYNYFDETNNFVKLPEAATLNLRGLSYQLSCVKYIYSNAKLDDKSIVKQLVDYVSGMLYFKSLTEGNMYIGFKNGAESLSQIIISRDKVADFQSFLAQNGLHYDIVPFKTSFGADDLGVRFENGNVVPFGSIISSGTKTLWLFYCWMLDFPNLSFLAIDEFDAYYQYHTARFILRLVNSFKNLQAVLTTHNLALMDNDMTRPDCCFILDRGQIKPLCQLTKKELRKTNNLEKMYKDNQFTGLFQKTLDDDSGEGKEENKSKQ